MPARKPQLKRFAGHNHKELAEETGYSVRRVYNILKKS